MSRPTTSSGRTWCWSRPARSATTLEPVEETGARAGARRPRAQVVAARAKARSARRRRRRRRAPTRQDGAKGRQGRAAKAAKPKAAKTAAKKSAAKKSPQEEGEVSDADTTSHDRAPDRHRAELGGVSGPRGVHVRGAPDANKTGDQPGDREAVRRQGDGVWTSNHRGKDERVGKSVGRKPHWKKAIVKLADGDTIDDLRGLSAHGRFVNSSQSPRASRFRSRLRFLGDHADDAGEVAARAAQEVAAGATITATSRCVASAVVTSGCTAIIDFKRNKFGDAGARCARSSTIRIARRASRWSSTRTARSATSCTRRGCKVGDTIVSGPGSDMPRRQRAAAARDPARHRRCTTSS